MRTRRRSTVLTPRSAAYELQVPKTVELEQRIARLELKLDRTSEELELNRHRMVALQAQLDHLLAKLGRF